MASPVPPPRPHSRCINQEELADIVAQRIRSGMWECDPAGQVVIFTGWTEHVQGVNGARRYWFTRTDSPPRMTALD